MDATEEVYSNWPHKLEKELARDFCDSKETAQNLQGNNSSSASHSTYSSIPTNKLISTVYSGPTITDIESALTLNYLNGGRNRQPKYIFAVGDGGHGNKMDNKNTVRMKSRGNRMAEDGYHWRKYGQKSIKNNPNPRSYYRCNYPQCNAKKQVEISVEDPEIHIVTYEGRHLHYTYSNFLLMRSQEFLPSVAGHHGPKNPKTQPMSSESPQCLIRRQQIGMMVSDNQQGGPQNDLVSINPIISNDRVQHDLVFKEERQGLQGLLEDIVPLIVRNPCSSATYLEEPPNSSQASSPLPSYSSTTASPTNFNLHGSILSNGYVKDKVRR